MRIGGWRLAGDGGADADAAERRAERPPLWLLSAARSGLRAAVDLRYIRDNVDAVQANLESRGSGAFASAHRVKALYETSLAAEFQVAQMRKQRNDVTKKFGAAKDKEAKESVTQTRAALALAAA